MRRGVDRGGGEKERERKIAPPPGAAISGQEMVRGEATATAKEPTTMRVCSSKYMTRRATYLQRSARILHQPTLEKGKERRERRSERRVGKGGGGRGNQGGATVL
eukprot:Sspe_Gene.86844::Locus_57640_Transcript_4_6_Confidence_0.278_Length_471::g.86844::m.86844